MVADERKDLKWLHRRPLVPNAMTQVNVRLAKSPTYAQSLPRGKCRADPFEHRLWPSTPRSSCAESRL